MRSFFLLGRAALLAALLGLPLPVPLFADELDAEAFGPALSSQAKRPIAPSRFEKGRGARKPVPRAGSFTMAEAVRHALDHSPGLGAAEAGARASEEGAKSDLALLFPSFSTSYGYSFYRQKESGSGTRASSSAPTRGTYTWSAQVSQLLFDGFKTLGTYQRQALQAESDKAALRQAELELAASVQQAFADYLASLENVASLREAAARLRDQLAITRAFNQEGLRPRLDVLQAEVDLSSAERELVSEENVRDTGLARLNTLLGLPAQAAASYAGTLAMPAFGKSLDECLAQASRLRPDLYVGYKAVEMAVKDRLVARSGYYPQVEAYYSVSSSGNTPDLRRSGEISSSSTTWEVGAQLNWELFQWGATYFADQQAGWLVAQARAKARGLMLDAGYEVKEKFLALREASARVEVARRSVAHAGEAYDAALASYKEGVGTNYEVLDASSSLLSAQTELTGARRDYVAALSALYLAMGEYRPDLSQN